MLRYRILGPVSVDADETPLPLSDHQRALLADLLINANQVVSHDRLIDDLWGEHPPPNARASLHNLIWKRRTGLGSDALETASHGYKLRVSYEELDALQFELLIARARLERSRQQIDLLEKALGLWSGEHPLARRALPGVRPADRNAPRGTAPQRTGRSSRGKTVRRGARAGAPPCA